jgi:prolipoprotein diacylglyceryltransferase
MWSYDYPHNVLNRGVPIEGCEWNYCNRLEAGVYPTPFYETVVSFIFAAILWGLRKRMKIAGTLFALYLIMNGVERFFIEKIRINDEIDFGAFVATQAEVISVLTFLAGVILWVILYRREKSR